MATKAERFRAESERKGLQNRRVKTPRGPGTSGARNLSKHAEQKATYGYEDSNADVARPSRKPSRGGSRNHIKPDNPLKNKALMERTISPKARQRMRGNPPATVRKSS